MIPPIVCFVSTLLGMLIGAFAMGYYKDMKSDAALETALDASDGRWRVSMSKLVAYLLGLGYETKIEGDVFIVDATNDNYLIDINPQTGAVKITGIDNDASFGTRKAGMTVVDLSRPTPRQQDFLSQLRREGYTIPPDGRIDLSKLPDRLLSETRSSPGIRHPVSGI